MAALELPKVGYATNADHGAGCNIHPPPKQYCGARLGDSALALAYGKGVAWKSPSFAGATCATDGGVATVTVKLSDVSSAGLSADTYPYNYLGGGMDCAAHANCAWASVKVGDDWVNASVSVADGGQTLTLATTGNTRGAAVSGSSYGWGGVPMMNAYDVGSGLPVLPWRAEGACASA
jgi:hypothetical protein